MIDNVSGVIHVRRIRMLTSGCTYCVFYRLPRRVTIAVVTPLTGTISRIGRNALSLTATARLTTHGVIAGAIVRIIVHVRNVDDLEVTRSTVRGSLRRIGRSKNVERLTRGSRLCCNTFTIPTEHTTIGEVGGHQCTASRTLHRQVRLLTSPFVCEFSSHSGDQCLATQLEASANFHFLVSSLEVLACTSRDVHSLIDRPASSITVEHQGRRA
uniref:Uncharacterized protein n=1 Tax=Anopheles culicifacies TaxID=139723 RepID=A0A182MQG1_9DIPT